MSVMRTAPLTILALMILAAMGIWFVYWLVNKGKIYGLTATIAGLEKEISFLERQNAELEKKVAVISEHKPGEATFPLFNIQIQSIRLNFSVLRLNDPLLLDPKTSIPHIKALELEIWAEITAVPPLLLQEVHLEIQGTRLPEQGWTPGVITQNFWGFSFNLPSSILPGKYQVRLIATVSKTASETVEHKSPFFEVGIS